MNLTLNLTQYHDTCTNGEQLMYLGKRIITVATYISQNQPTTRLLRCVGVCGGGREGYFWEREGGGGGGGGGGCSGSAIIIHVGYF